MSVWGQEKTFEIRDSSHEVIAVATKNINERAARIVPWLSRSSAFSLVTSIRASLASCVHNHKVNRRA
jgi:hypothetical protein